MHFCMCKKKSFSLSQKVQSALWAQKENWELETAVLRQKLFKFSFLKIVIMPFVEL
jgi:hypothetical protein